MAKWLPCRTAASADVVRPIDTIIIGGLAVRWVADKARKPAGPSVPFAVTIATPMARQPMAFQKVFASISLSIKTGSFFRGEPRAHSGRLESAGTEGAPSPRPSGVHNSTGRRALVPDAPNGQSSRRRTQDSPEKSLEASNQPLAPLVLPPGHPGGHVVIKRMPH